MQHRTSGADFKHRLLLLQLEFLFSAALRTLPFTVLVPLVLVLFLRQSVPVSVLLIWWGGFALLFPIRLAHSRSRLNLIRSKSAPPQALAEFLAGSSLSALLWGCGYVVMRQYLPVHLETLYIFGMGGIIAGAMVPMAVSRLVYGLYVGIAVTPVIVATVLEGGEFHLSIALTAALFGLMLVISHRVAYGLITDGFAKGLENEDLAKRLDALNRNLRTSNIDLEAAKARLREQAMTDPLTGLHNRRALEEFLKQAWAKATQDRSPIACILIDIDHFKLFNDNHGHPAGDRCLKQVAKMLARGLRRSGDFVCRYGGEEFLIVAQGTDEAGARGLAEKLRKASEDLYLDCADAPAKIAITISAGVATCIPTPRQPAQELVQSADDALYQAKVEGRNRVEIATPRRPGQ